MPRIAPVTTEQRKSLASRQQMKPIMSMLIQLIVSRNSNYYFYLYNSVYISSLIFHPFILSIALNVSVAFNASEVTLQTTLKIVEENKAEFH